ncbi:MAG: 3-hydroxyacyl-ACP dehydratase FabZ [Candidatus Omnitrophota bacterium]
MSKGKKEYSFQEIRSLLPQDYPFIFLDKAVIQKRSKKITCIKNVTGNEYFFAGHFKDYPVMPGTLLIEAMAQAACLFGKISSDKKTTQYYLAGIQNFRFIRPVFPGDQMVIEVEMRLKIRNVELANGKAWVNSKIVCKGELMFAKR